MFWVNLLQHEGTIEAETTPELSKNKIEKFTPVEIKYDDIYDVL